MIAEFSTFLMNDTIFGKIKEKRAREIQREKKDIVNGDSRGEVNY